MHLAANLSDTITREMCHRKSETFAKNYFTFNSSKNELKTGKVNLING